MNLYAALVINIGVLLLRHCKELLVVKKLHCPHGFLHLHPPCDQRSRVGIGKRYDSRSGCSYAAPDRGQQLDCIGCCGIQIGCTCSSQTVERRSQSSRARWPRRPARAAKRPERVNARLKGPRSPSDRSKAFLAAPPSTSAPAPAPAAPPHRVPPPHITRPDLTQKGGIRCRDL